MNPTKILVPTDFSASSNAAFEIANLLIRSERHSEILLLHVETPAVVRADSDLGDLTPDRLMKKLQAAHTLQHSSPSVKVTEIFVQGDPAKQILNHASSHSINLIVMGSHGRTGLLHLLMGSVAEEVNRRASCPVLIIKLPDE